MRGPLHRLILTFFQCKIFYDPKLKSISLLAKNMFCQKQFYCSVLHLGNACPCVPFSTPWHVAAHNWQSPLCGKWSLLTLAVLPQLVPSLGPRTGSGIRTKASHVMPVSFPGTLHYLAGKNTTENLGLHKER